MFVTFLVTIALLLVVVSAQEYPKVPLDVYYEALCPSCQQFITTTLTTVWAMDDIVAITDLKMVPYGNTKKNEDGTFTCQHGPDECTTDVIEQCVLYELSGDLASIIDGTTSEAAFPFIQCMEFAEGDPSAATGCFAKTMAGKVDLDWPTVEKCTKTSELDVQNSAMKATPSHDYVPWILVNGELLDNTELLLVAICTAYTGPKPESCSKKVQLNKIEALPSKSIIGQNATNV